MLSITFRLPLNWTLAVRNLFHGIKRIFMKNLFTAIIVIAALNVAYIPFSYASGFEKPNAQKTGHVESNTSKISLNDANYEQLLSLKGIGKKKAEAIISYRQEVGSFSEIEELLLVSGIGKKVIQENEDRLVL